ncbi:MAG: universal stress protein A [Halieaceae bacterium]|jgi:universal stress protein A
MQIYDKALIALELYGSEEYLIEAAVKVALEKAEISFIHVFQTPIYPADSYLGGIPLQRRDEEMAEADVKLSALAAKYQLPKEGHILVVGRPASEIHRTAIEMGADLIVVGSHGRHGIQLLLGSTSNAVLHGASCDVLAVRIQEQTSNSV